MKKTNADKFQVAEINDSLVYVTSPDFSFGLDDELDQQFGVLFEITDMDEATGEPEYKDYPFVVSASIVADQCHESFNELEESHKPDKLSLLQDAFQYMGGVPIDHTLTTDIKNGTENEEAFQTLCNKFKVGEATVKTVTHNYGTVAAQQGPGTENQYLQFKDEKAARKMVDYLIKHRITALSMMIGFILDRPINLMGDNGWSVIRKMVNGC